MQVGSVVLDDRKSMLKRGMARAIRKETRQALHKSTMDKSPVAKFRCVSFGLMQLSGGICRRIQSPPLPTPPTPFSFTHQMGA